jgi:alkanesulfonate monooxygenase SsuD/methylene tetrahydromethanopterin reductase-like flavin-dependent oxidoreductase (luciferase family)
MTTHPDRFLPTWEASLAVAKIFDDAGLEAIVPYSRWKPFGGASHITGTTLDTFTWAAAISAVTRYSSIFATVHAHAVHPLVAAKQGATIDQISGGRFSLNLVVGFYLPEIETFGIDAGTKEDRYDLGEAWIDAVKRLWTEDREVDVDTPHIRIKGGVSTPKPVQKPSPPIMNAGSSDRGRQLAGRYADIAFVVSQTEDPAAIAEQVASYKDYARETFGREIQVWGYGLVIQRDTLEEAQASLHSFTSEYNDIEAVDEFAKYMFGSEMPADQLAALRPMIASGGSMQLVGTANDIADKLEMMSDCGMDGVLLTFVDYASGSRDFVDTVLPIVESRGLRAPHIVPMEAA